MEGGQIIDILINNDIEVLRRVMRGNLSRAENLGHRACLSVYLSRAASLWYVLIKMYRGKWVYRYRMRSKKCNGRFGWAYYIYTEPSGESEWSQVPKTPFTCYTICAAPGFELCITRDMTSVCIRNASNELGMKTSRCTVSSACVRASQCCERCNMRLLGSLIR